MDPQKTAIVLVDDQNDFLSKGGKLHGVVEPVLKKYNIIENINTLLKAVRSKGIMVIHVPLQFSADYSEMGDNPYGIFKVIKDSGSFQIGSWGAKIADTLDVKDTDLVVNGKSTTCAFARTDLDSALKNHGITIIVLGGLLTNICIESTMRTAYNTGYEVYTLTNCSATISDKAQSAAMEHNWPMFSIPVTNDKFLNKLTSN